MKPTIMILGSGHLANPGMDAFNTKMDDVLAPKRQREIEQLVRQLKAFRPTKIAIEADERFDAKINANYRGYLEGTYQLKRGKATRLGFGWQNRWDIRSCTVLIIGQSKTRFFQMILTRI